MFSYAMIPSRTIIRTSRLLHTTSRLSATSRTSGGQDPSVSQGHAVSQNNQSPQDIHSEHARAGMAESKNEGPDAASQSGRAQQVPDKGKFSGNQEGVGMQEQIGGKSAEGSGGVKGGEEEASPPGIFAALKSKVGLGTSSGEVKQNRGAGEGVTGTGTGPKQVGSRGLHTSAVKPSPEVSKAEPEGSRTPKDTDVQGEQNAHLTHKSAGERDHGRGNASDEPTLPSRRNEAPADRITNPAGGKQQARSYHMSARRMAEDKPHSAESYFKDVDETAPPDSKTHSVAYGSEVQRASEPPSGEWSRKGAESKEYDTVSKDEPYSPPAPGAESEKLRYGNREEWGDQPGKGQGGTSHPGEGPAGDSAGGRKPERSS
ncbi:hypothetical protein OE88DRAFT_1728773 [Heliocybe sulcata]|uniref:Uncharacterized protein n=1 Tax=Heliocybe sulcata TaxID=5364 RepID=A0A5C3MRG7_9AGAM|nr:hypothetical protein OE88DRAFT_1728773 [Heliocybe sulcata]